MGAVFIYRPKVIMETITEKNGIFYYYNKWKAEHGSHTPALILTEWIYTDKDLAIFQKWLDKKGRS